MAAIRNSSSITLLDRRIEIESHELEQLLILHLGQHKFSAASKQIPGKLLLRLDHLVDLVLHGAAADEFVDKHIPSLPDSESPVSGLVFHSRVPPPVEMDDMRGSGEIEPGAACLEGEHEKWDVFVLLELANKLLALPDLRLAVQDDAGPPKHGTQERRQRRRRLPELGKDQRLLLPGGDHFRDIPQTRQLAAVLLGPCTVAEPLGWMVADLLEPHEKGEDHASALHAIDVLKLACQLIHGLAVKCRLLAAQRAEGFHLGLVGQVGNDGLVGLQA